MAAKDKSQQIIANKQQKINNPPKQQVQHAHPLGDDGSGFGGGWRSGNFSEPKSPTTAPANKVQAPAPYGANISSIEEVKMSKHAKRRANKREKKA